MTEEENSGEQLSEEELRKIELETSAKELSGEIKLKFNNLLPRIKFGGYPLGTGFVRELSKNDPNNRRYQDMLEENKEIAKDFMTASANAGLTQEEVASYSAFIRSHLPCDWSEQNIAFAKQLITKLEKVFEELSTKYSSDEIIG